MSETLLVLGIILGLTLSGLLVCTVACEKFKFWPTPGKGTWQSLLFWGLFRGLNVTTLTMGFVCFQPWQDFYPRTRGGRRDRDSLWPPLRVGAPCPWPQERLLRPRWARHRRHLRLDAQSAIRNGNPGLSLPRGCLLLGCCFRARVAAYPLLRADGVCRGALARSRLWRGIPALPARGRPLLQLAPCAWLCSSRRSCQQGTPPKNRFPNGLNTSVPP